MSALCASLAMCLATRVAYGAATGNEMATIAKDVREYADIAAGADGGRVSAVEAAAAKLAECGYKIGGLAVKALAGFSKMMTGQLTYSLCTGALAVVAKAVASLNTTLTMQVTADGTKALDMAFVKKATADLVASLEPCAFDYPPTARNYAKVHGVVTAGVPDVIEMCGPSAGRAAAWDRFSAEDGSVAYVNGPWGPYTGSTVPSGFIDTLGSVVKNTNRYIVAFSSIWGQLAVDGTPLTGALMVAHDMVHGSAPHYQFDESSPGTAPIIAFYANGSERAVFIISRKAVTTFQHITRDALKQGASTVLVTPQKTTGDTLAFVLAIRSDKSDPARACVATPFASHRADRQERPRA